MVHLELRKLLSLNKNLNAKWAVTSLFRGELVHMQEIIDFESNAFNVNITTCFECGRQAEKKNMIKEFFCQAEDCRSSPSSHFQSMKT